MLFYVKCIVCLTITLLNFSIKDIKMKLETSIYDNLPATTESGNVVIHKVYQRKGVEYARSIGGAFTLRVRGMDKHFGNPYSHVRALCEKDNLVLTATTKDAVIMFIHYVLRSMDSFCIRF